MCGRKSKIFSVLLVQFFLLFCSQHYCSCYAKVVLTDQQAEAILNEIQESEKDLQELQIQLEDVKRDYSEQKIYYEKQLDEAKKQKKKAETVAITNGVVSAFLTVILVFTLLL